MLCSAAAAAAAARGAEGAGGQCAARGMAEVGVARANDAARARRDAERTERHEGGSADAASAGSGDGAAAPAAVGGAGEMPAAHATCVERDAVALAECVAASRIAAQRARARAEAALLANATAQLAPLQREVEWIVGELQRLKAGAIALDGINPSPANDFMETAGGSWREAFYRSAVVDAVLSEAPPPDSAVAMPTQNPPRPPARASKRALAKACFSMLQHMLKDRWALLAYHRVCAPEVWSRGGAERSRNERRWRELEFVVAFDDDDGGGAREGEGADGHTSGAAEEAPVESARVEGALPTSAVLRAGAWWGTRTALRMVEALARESACAAPALPVLDSPPAAAAAAFQWLERIEGEVRGIGGSAFTQPLVAAATNAVCSALGLGCVAPAPSAGESESGRAPVEAASKPCKQAVGVPLQTPISDVRAFVVVAAAAAAFQEQGAASSGGSAGQGAASVARRPAGVRDGHLLYTVTFYANHAHNLTRSP